MCDIDQCMACAHFTTVFVPHNGRFMEEGRCLMDSGCDFVEWTGEEGDGAGLQGTD